MRIDPRALLHLPVPTLALGALNVGLCIGLLCVAFGGTRASELLATPARPPTPLNIELRGTPTAPDLSAIQDKPLMHASRVFYSAPPPDAAPQAPPLPDYRLAGSFHAPKRAAVALLARREGGSMRRVRAGDDLDGWRVDAIESRRVVLRWQDQTREILSAPPQLNAGLKRVPLQRQRVAAVRGTVVSLGATGAAASFNGGAGQVASDPPRLYRHPPN
jgi:hypothetical protein